jgi:tetratricopeptide (TPR) repeat protein
VRKCTGLDLEIDLVQHEVFVEGTPKLFGLILVRSATKKSKLKQAAMPSTDFKSSERWGIRRGEIFVRSGDSTKRIESGSELNDLLDDLESRYQEEEIEQANALPSPFAVEQGLYRLLPREYGTFVGRERYKEVLRQAIEGDPRIWIVNLFGPGGVGKSALATWLAYQYYRQGNPFEAILHLSAKDLELSAEEGIRRLSPTLYSLEDFLDRVLRLFDVFSEEELAQSGIEQQKKLVTEALVAYRVLLILDNMETINDGRLMEFVRTLPSESQSKVLLTSRRRTAEWEYPIRVTELDESEVKQLLQVRSAELGLDLPIDDSAFVQRIKEMSGGLPLAIQWMLGEYRKTNRLNKILSRALTPDSPLLEFSFRNSWKALEVSAQQALAVLSVFVDPPTAQEWRTTLDWSVDKMESAIASLIEATFVSERTEPRTGKVIYAALPITLTFARNELSKMGDLEREARLRYQGYRNRLELAAVETGQYSSLFEQYDAQTETQKKSIVLCRMAEGQAGRLGYEAADQYFKQAMGVEPRSVYTLVSYGQFKAELGRYGEAIELMERASQHCTKKTGFHVYFKLADVYD